MSRETDQNYNLKDDNTGFCGGCRSNCPLSDPNCPTGMERAGWSSEEIEKAMIERAVPIKINRTL
jgi:hypothetical protein